MSTLLQPLSLPMAERSSFAMYLCPGLRWVCLSGVRLELPSVLRLQAPQDCHLWRQLWFGSWAGLLLIQAVRSKLNDLGHVCIPAMVDLLTGYLLA